MEKVSFPIVRIEWIDPTSIDEWMPRGEALEHHCHAILTTGFLVAENEKVYVVALNIDAYNDDISCTMLIPKSALIRPMEIIG